MTLTNRGNNVIIATTLTLTAVALSAATYSVTTTASVHQPPLQPAPKSSFHNYPTTNPTTPTIHPLTLTASSVPLKLPIPQSVNRPCPTDDDGVNCYVDERQSHGHSYIARLMPYAKGHKAEQLICVLYYLKSDAKDDYCTLAN